MLPPLGNLAVGARTGVLPEAKRRDDAAEDARSKVMSEADLVTAVLEAIKVDDWRTACTTAKAWCAADQLRWDTCSEAHGSWRILNERYFRGSPLNGRWVNPIVDFYENCRRAMELAEGDYSLENEDLACATFILEALKWTGSGHEWGRVATSLKNDRAFALKAATVQGDVLEYMHPRYQRDREIVLAAVKNQGHALQYADLSFRSDEEIALAAVTNNGAALRYVNYPLKSNRNIVIVAVQNSPFALQWASASMTKRREVVLAAVRSHGAQLQFVDQSLRNNREVVLAAIDHHPLALQYAGYELRNDRAVALAAVRKNGLALQFAGEQTDADREVVLTAVRDNPRALQYANYILRDDYDVVMEAVTSPIVHGETALRYASARLRANVAIVRAAVRNDRRAHYWSLEPAASDEMVLRIHNARRAY